MPRRDAEPPLELPVPAALDRSTARSQRVSNRRLKEAMGWASRYAAVVEGWPAMLAQVEDTR